MGVKRGPRGGPSRGFWTAGVMAALIAGLAAEAFVPAQAQTASTCLSIENKRSRQTSVTVVGFNETSGYWAFDAGESAVLMINDAPIRGSAFTIQLYDGEGIDSARQLEGSNKYVNWRYDAQVTDNGKCPDGAWVATLHDPETSPVPAASGPKCLAVENTTSGSVYFTVDGWNQYTWTWRPNEELTYVSVNGIDIKSRNPDGSFTVRGASGSTINSANTRWTFHQELTGGQGQVGTCGGTWVMTIHEPAENQ